MDINDKKDLDTWQRRWEELQRRELEESREVAERRTPEFDHATSDDRDLVRAIADNDRYLFAMSSGGADVNARGLDGRTPPFWAAHARTDPHFAEALLGRGADVRRATRMGRRRSTLLRPTGTKRASASSSTTGRRLTPATRLVRRRCTAPPFPRGSASSRSW